MTGSLRVLCLNAGSSSLKFALWQMPLGTTATREAEQVLLHGAAERLGSPDAELWIAREGFERWQRSQALADPRDALQALMEHWNTLRLPAPHALGHRVVHGGPAHAAPERITPQLLAALHALTPLAPLHVPPALAVIDAALRQFPELPQVACFDTAFHRDLPDRAKRLPLPRALFDSGVRRYGFHGLSFEYVRAHLPAAASGKVIIAHLGSGASLAALRNGASVDTSMGFSPSGGLMMGTRSGDLDPGVLSYLQSARGYDAHALEHLVNHESGLLGVSGWSSDVKRLLERRAEHEAAAQAIELFCYTVQKQIGAYAAALGGVDTLVFTGGIGERAAPIRAEVCAPLEFLGIKLDLEANRQNLERISDPRSRCAVHVIVTDEARMIARHTRDALADQSL